MLNKQYTIDEIDSLAEELLPLLKMKVVLLQGEMGVGKTTLIKALCKALKVEDKVSSPTFSLINEYENTQGEIIYHFDCYRLETAEEALDFGAEEYLYSGHLCLIEWPENIATLIPDEHQCIRLEKINPKTRQLTLL
ncbi:MAG: tRNA (adenosine(37)-N6)-threonylcarbamoyltransferase complex ATPase subunit type 1 TsaE [Flavobacteriaceae bacterium]